MRVFFTLFVFLFVKETSFEVTSSWKNNENEPSKQLNKKTQSPVICKEQRTQQAREGTCLPHPISLYASCDLVNFLICRSSHRRCSVKKDVLKKFRRIHRKAPVLESPF